MLTTGCYKQTRPPRSNQTCVLLRSVNQTGAQLCWGEASDKLTNSRDSSLMQSIPDAPKFVKERWGLVVDINGAAAAEYEECNTTSNSVAMKVLFVRRSVARWRGTVTVRGGGGQTIGTRPKGTVPSTS